MDASNRLNFGFDSGRGISLDYAGSGMDRGLPDFSIQLPVVSTRSDISLPSCVSTNVFSQPLSTFESKKSVLIPNSQCVSFKRLKMPQNRRTRH